jgi:energy-converting hydrogenase B subunit D
MTALIIVSLTLVAVMGAAVVMTGAPQRQAVTLSFFGLTLTGLFTVLDAPDVALSQLGVGSAFVPLMVLLAIRTMAGHRRKERAGK